MKTILELQQEIHSLRNDISKMDTNLAMIESELNSMQREKIRKATGGNHGIEFDYNLFQRLAKNLPFINHALFALQEEYSCKLYLKFLLSLVWMDENAAVEKLTYVQWIYGKIGAVQGVSLEDLYKDSVQLDKTYFQELSDLLLWEYKENLVVDSLVVANMSGKSVKEVLELIGNICGIFGFDKEKIKNYSDIANFLLCWNNDKNLTEYEEDIILLNQNILGYYINKSLINEILEKKRDLVVAYDQFSCEVSGFRWTVGQKSAVKEGEVIGECNKEAAIWIFAAGGLRKAPKSTQVVATSSGTLFQFKTDYNTYGVISHRVDSMEAIEEWIKKMEELESD